MDISSIIKRMYDMKIIFFCMDIVVYDLLLFLSHESRFCDSRDGPAPQDHNHLDNLSYPFVNEGVNFYYIRHHKYDKRIILMFLGHLDLK